MAKLGGDDACPLRTGERSPELLEVVIGEPGGPHDGVDLLGCQPYQVVSSCFSNGEVHHHIGTGISQRLPVGNRYSTTCDRTHPIGVHCGHQIQFRVSSHRFTDGGTHSAPCAEHPYPKHE